MEMEKSQRYAKDNRTAHLIACSDKSVAYVANNKRLYTTFWSVEANYWQTRSIIIIKGCMDYHVEGALAGPQDITAWTISSGAPFQRPTFLQSRSHLVYQELMANGPMVSHSYHGRAEDVSRGTLQWPTRWHSPTFPWHLRQLVQQRKRRQTGKLPSTLH